MTQETDPLKIAARRIAKARTRLLLEKKFIFWATCALHLKPVPAQGLQTMGVDGEHLFYDPELIASDHWDEDELMAVVAHEVSHCAKGDIWRRGGRDAEKWNIAADMRINPELINAGLRLPKGHLGKPSDLGRAAEEIYNTLPDNPGGGAGGKNGRIEINIGNCGAVWDAGSAPGNNAADKIAVAKSQERTWTIIAKQAAQLAKAQGFCPAGYEHLLVPVKPKLDPYAMLRHFVSMCRKDDYSWGRPNRRYLWNRMYLPSLWSEGIGEIVIAADVSGSTHSVWPKFVGFLGACLEEAKPEKTWFIEIDAAVHNVTEYGVGEQLPERISIHGGGGTDMRPIWEYISEHNIQPVCVIVLSDMEMGETYFGKPQTFPVLWVSSEKGREAPWGETVEMVE